LKLPAIDDISLLISVQILIVHEEDGIHKEQFSVFPKGTKSEKV